MSLVLLVCIITQICDVLVLIYVYDLSRYFSPPLFTGWFCKDTNNFLFDQIRKIKIQTLLEQPPH